MNKLYSNFFQDNYKIDKSNYFNYINNNKNLIYFQKKRLDKLF